MILETGKREIVSTEKMRKNKGEQENMDQASVKERILEATISVFNQKGLKFTMDDIAKELAMSKKTIYTVFRDKESMFYAMVDYCFDKIKASEQEVLHDRSLDTKERLRRLLGVLPDGYKDIDFRQLYSLKDRYPKIYKKVEERLESGWETTISLIEQGIEEGVFRPIHIQVVKTMFEATLEQFFQRDILILNGISYSDALEEVVSILMQGIVA